MHRCTGLDPRRTGPKDVNLGGAQKVAHCAVVGTGEGSFWIFSRANGGEHPDTRSSAIDVFPMVEGEHPSVRPSFVGGAQKVARGGKLGNARTA